LTRQAVQLGFWPRVRIIHTSGKNEGQIYVPSVNWALLCGSLILVVEYRSASGLAAAYGTAVSAAMAATSVLFAVVALRQFGKSSLQIGVTLVAFLTMDLGFLIPSLTRIYSGGWVPLAIGAAVFIVMTTWREGRDIVYRLIQAEALPIDLLLPDLASGTLLRVPGTAVFVTENTDGVPNVLLHHVKHCKSLHEQVVLLRVIGERVPIVPPSRQLAVEDLGESFFRFTLRHGFMQTVDVPAMIHKAAKAGHIGSASAVSYYLGRETLVTSGHAHMRRWRKAVFAFLQRNARSATEFFGLPPRRVVELGAQMEI
jgi:KUP system potassium uptake protein